MCYDTNYIYRSLLLKFVNLFDRYERVTFLSDTFCVFYFLDDRVSIEHQTVVILDAGVLFVCNFDISTWEQVYLSFL